MNETPTHLDLFSGDGGFALAAAWAGFRTVAFCEIDPYCQRVIAQNFDAEVVSNPAAFGRIGRSDNKGKETTERTRTPIISDIRDLDGRKFYGVNLITGGFPCQPYSHAGKRGGTSDDRDQWPEMLRVIEESQPDFVLGENVVGIETMEFRRVVTRVEDHPALFDGHEEVHICCESALVFDACIRDGLEQIGYSVQPFCIPAIAVDARHRRDRIWIIASRNSPDTESERLQGLRSSGLEESRAHGQAGLSVRASADISNANSSGPQKRSREGGQGIQRVNAFDRESGAQWLPEPGICRVAHGIPSRVDRIKGLGNAIVPQVAFEIIYEIGQLIRTGRHGDTRRQTSVEIND